MAVLVRCDDVGVRGGVECGGDVNLGIKTRDQG